MQQQRSRRGGVSAETYSEEDATSYVKKVYLRLYLDTLTFALFRQMMDIFAYLTNDLYLYIS